MSRALWLPDVFRDAGLPVKVEPGWDTRGRPSLNPHWLVVHHTASGRRSGNAPSLGVCRDGRGGPNPVAGPLCNWLTARDGTIHVVASGVANHAGQGKYPDGTTGNARSLGDEAENDGVGEPWPGRQLDNIAAAHAAVCRHMGWAEHRVIGHREFALPKGRKIDPSFDLDAHRARVRQLLVPVEVASVNESEEDDTMFLRGLPSGRIFHVYGERYRHLSPDKWNRRRFFGATIPADRNVPDESLDNLVSDLIKDPS